MSKKYLKKKEKKIWPLLVIGVILVAGLAIGMIIWKSNMPENVTAQATDPTPVVDQGVETQAPVVLAEIETVYGSLYVSEANADKLVHQEVVDAGVAMERFSMILGQQEKELFRIYFGDAAQGDPVGCLRTENGDVIISVAVCTYEASDFPNEEDFALYHTLMEELNTILDSIFSDSRYHVLDKVEGTEPQKLETELKFWKFELPKTMELMEHDQNGLYWVDFYCSVSEERVLIYTVYLGETEVDTLIGYYTADGVQKPVGVKTADIQPKGHWSDEDIATVNAFMATINDVIQVIMADENFSEQMPE